MAEMGGMTWEAGPGRGGEAEAGPQQSSGGFWDGEWGGDLEKTNLLQDVGFYV